MFTYIMRFLYKQSHVPSLTNLTILIVSSLVFFLAYTSQFLFFYLEPGALSQVQALWFNLFVLFIWWCYYNACTVNAAPKDWVSKAFSKKHSDGNEVLKEKTTRWCRKCQAIKPLRAHHCKICTTCVPKMDHHCPWTANCVSYLTFPHYIRFVFYSVVSMSILAYHLNVRVFVLWQKRHTPAYLGPSSWAILHMLALLFLNSVILLALTILLCRSIYGLATNVTTIENWEIERHEALIQRCRRSNGYVFAAGGQPILIEHQEFPYDIGIWKNLHQTMGTTNIFMWFMPFGGAPTVESAGSWEVNGFEETDKDWPPLNPDKVRQNPWHHEVMKEKITEIFKYDDPIAEFKKRQNADLRRRGLQTILEIENSHTDCNSSSSKRKYNDELGIDMEIEWTNSDGDRLQNYGVDEEDAGMM